MMRFFKIITIYFFCELISFSIYAQDKMLDNFINLGKDFVSDEKPTAYVHFNFNDIHFNTLKKINCASSSDAAGCTHYKLGFDLNHDCSNNRVDITIKDVEKSPLIELNEQYKNSPFLDQILKHEMTHVQIYRGNTKKIATQLASSVVAKYDILLTQSHSCHYIKSEIYTHVSSKFYEMVEEIEKKQKLIDGNKNYLYQSLQVLQKDKN